MEEAVVLWLGANQEELRQFLPDARLHVPRIGKPNFPRTQETHARKVLLQFQEGGTTIIRGTCPPVQRGA